MKIRLNTAVLQVDGVNAYRDGENKVVRTKDIVLNCLTANRPGDDPKQKMEDANLAEKAYAAGAEAEFAVEEVARMKKLVEVQPPVIMKRCWDVLDPPPEPEEDKDDD